ncbi:actin-like protein arp8, partial [Nowakowskiella sp. JEL0078]
SLFHPKVLKIEKKMRKFLDRKTYLDVGTNVSDDFLFELIDPSVSTGDSYTTGVLTSAVSCGSLFAARVLSEKSGLPPVSFTTSGIPILSKNNTIHPIQIPVPNTFPFVKYSDLVLATRNITPNLSTKQNTEEMICDSISMPIDTAIAMSIARYTQFLSLTYEDKDADDRLRRILSVILVVGGGAKLSGFTEFLRDRLDERVREHIIMPSVQRKWLKGLTTISGYPGEREQIAAMALTAAEATPMVSVQVLSSPRDLDPHMLVWKGASVLVRLESVSYLWVGRSEWIKGGIEKLLQKTIT